MKLINPLIPAALRLCLPLVAMLLVSCGGGSSESPAIEASLDASSVAPPQNAAPADDSNPETPLTGTQSLVADENFGFSSKYSVEINVSTLAEYEHLTLCQVSQGGSSSDYSNCMLNASLQQGQYQGELLLTHQTQDLVATLWDFDNALEPQHKTWNRDSDGLVINIF